MAIAVGLRLKITLYFNMLVLQVRLFKFICFEPVLSKIALKQNFLVSLCITHQK